MTEQNILADQKAKDMAKKFGLGFVKLSGQKIDKKILNFIPKNVANEYKIIAYDYQETPQKILKIAVSEPEKLTQKAPQIVVDLKKQQGFNLELYVTTQDDFNWAISQYDAKLVEPVKPISKPQQDKVESAQIKPVEQKTQASVKVPNLRPLPSNLARPLDTQTPIAAPMPDKPQALHEIKNIGIAQPKEQKSIEPAIKEVEEITPQKIDSQKITPQKIQPIPVGINQQVNNNISLIGKKIPYVVLSKFPKQVALSHQMVVFSAPIGTNTIKVGLVDPKNSDNQKILDYIKKKNNLNIEQYQISKADFDYAIGLYNGGQNNISKSPSVSSNTEDKMPAAKPIKNLDEQKLPPLERAASAETIVEPKEENGVKELSSKEAGVDEEVKKEEVQGIAQNAPTNFVSNEEEEKNLDVLLPNGIKNIENLKTIVKEGMVPKIVAGMIYFAVEQNASDIHLEPTNEDLRLRYRVDGVLQDVLKMPLALHPPVISRIKIIARLRIDEQRIPQDGRIGVLCDKKDIDIRVSSLPTVHGEKIVMRLLDKSSGLKNIKELGFSGENLKRVVEAIAKPYGIVLTTGPTGSGKTTTLYSLLRELNKPGVNIVTFEDPVEYEIQGINQCQIKPKIGFNFAEGLRSVLRQDPNIIMVGEIRDPETAGAAVHAALTGHLVLSTLHTNSAAGAMPRLVNMGVEPFLITSSINAIIAQRLVRKLCPKCREKVNPPQATLDEIKRSIDLSHNSELAAYKGKELTFFKPKGCEYCKDGYHGRIGLYEVMVMSNKIEDLSVARQSADKIEEQAIAEGMITLRQDGIIKALSGLTSLDEILKETEGDK